MAQRRLEVVIAGDNKGAKKAIDDTEQGAGGLGDKLKSALGGAPALIAGAAIGAVAGIGTVLRGAYDAADQAAKVTRETERVIRTTGGAANVSAQQVSDLGDRLSDLTGIDHKVVQGTENMLLTFTGVRNELGEGNDVFNRATGLALDLATVMKEDSSTAAVQLGKALNDPIKGLTALRRVGVSFTEQQQEQIKEMVKAGDTLGAQKIILDELGKEFGGAAEAASTPLEKLENKVSRFQEAVGAKLLPAVDAAATWIGANLPNAVERATGFLSDHLDAVEALAAVGLAGLAAAYGPVIAAQVAMVASNVGGFFTTLAAEAIYAGQAFLTVAGQQGVLTASTQALGYAMDSTAVALPVLGLAVFGVMHFYNEGARAADEFKASVEAKYDTTTLDGLRGAIADYQVKVDEAGKAGSTMAERLNIPEMLRAQSTYDKMSDSLNDLRSKEKETESALWDAAKAIQAQQDPALRTSEGLQKLHDQLDRIADAKKIDPTSQGAIDKLVQLQAAASSATPAADQLGQSVEELAGDTENATEKLKSFKEALDAAIGVHLQAEEAENRYAASLDAVAQKVGAGINLNDAYTARNREARDAILNSVQAAEAHATSIYQETASLDVAGAALEQDRARLIQTAVQHGVNRQKAEEFINTLGLTPDNVRTIVHADTAAAEANVQRLQGQLWGIGAHPYVAVAYLDISAAEANLRRYNVELNDLERRVIASNATYGGRFADGGVVRSYAAGGWENHVAQFAAGGTMRLWAEPETGGEAYIPLATSKRRRSTEILGDVAGMFGYGLMPVGARFVGGPGGGTTIVHETHVHVHAGTIVADEEALGRVVNRAQLAAQRQGVKMPWDS